MIRFFVAGIPRPGGSKTATVVRRKDGSIVMANGRPLVTTRDDAKGNKDWKASVGFTAAKQHLEPLTGPLRLRIVFTMPWRKGDLNKWGNPKPGAPQFHTVKPDATKLLRSTEDALTGILWIDDACVMPSVVKVYGKNPGAMIEVEPMPTNCVREAIETADLFVDAMP